MKKLLYLFSCVALSGFLFTACEEDPTEDLSPSLKIETSSAYLVDGDTIEPGDAIDISVIASANTSSTSPLVELEISAIFNNADLATIDTTVDIDKKDAYNKEFSFVAPSTEGTGIITIKATDKDGETSTVTIGFTVQSSGSVALESSSITLGDQENENGSFYASLSGEVYTITELTAASAYASIDIIYYYGSKNKQALLSPKAVVDNDINWTVGATQLLPKSNWGTTPNATKFKKGTSADYDNATANSVETAVDGASLDIANGGAVPIDGLKSGDVYLFETASGDIGVFKVTSVGATVGTTITLDVKIVE